MARGRKGKGESVDEIGVVALPCTCASLRRAARAVTEIYEREMEPSGLRVTQFGLLNVIGDAGTITQRRLGRVLGLDTTTLSRTLKPLVDRGWIASAPGRDRRKHNWALTPEGEAKLLEAQTYWNRAQERIREGLGDQGWAALHGALDRVTRLARAGGNSAS